MWRPVSDKVAYGVVVCNFRDERLHMLKLWVGDTVHVMEELEDWYFGYNTKVKSELGIFPKNHIYIKDAIIDKTGIQDAIIPREPPIVQEITSVLRERGSIWKQLYVCNHKEFLAVRKMMYELIEWRRNIMSGTLPVDELKELKQKVTSKIDMGNAILGLDLVVRDEQGNILNPDVTSSIQLYRHHELATQRIKRETSNAGLPRTQKVTTKYSHCLFVTVKNFVCRIGEDADLLMTLYDGKESAFISENYLIRWGNQGMPKDIDMLNNLRVLFTDLGSKDLARERVYLVCQIIRIGNMELKDNSDHRKHSQLLRRPFGVAAMDVTDFINGKIEGDEEKQHFTPFQQCGDRDFLDNVIRKVLAAKEINHKGQGLWVSVKMLHGDVKQIKEDYPHIVSNTTAIARKMGFPEVILPGDVRNDIYLTIIQGEFTKGNKSSDKNVEVTVSVRNEKGQLILNVISMGSGTENISEYKSVVYYHEDKPKWNETIKVAIPIEEFYGSHLKFIFKHRSSNDVKDRVEKPFAMSFVKLMQENGTTLKDITHDLLVYKIEHKKFEDNDVLYLNLPATKQEWESKILNHGHPSKSSSLVSGLSFASKDNLQISTLVCSTKLTQNIDLLGLLKWWANPDNLKENLHALMKVDGEEIVKFLQDTLDALFNILMQNSDSDLYDNLVFDALIFIIGLIADRKYHHFRPVLDLYIKENFSATLAYNKLMVVLKYYIDNANESLGQESLLRAMKALEYIFKFIISSRVLFAELNEGKGKQQFEISMKQLLQSITGMMFYTTDSTLLVQGAALKYLPTIIPDLFAVFDPKELSNILVDFINNVPSDRLTKQKMICINDIVHSQVYKYPECRSILTPMITRHIEMLFQNDDEIELCVKILGDIMEVLAKRDVGPTHDDVSEIMLSLLRTVIQTVISMDRVNPLVGNLVAVMIAILRQMSEYHYQQYISHFPTQSDLLDFLMEILLVFRDLVSKNVYPKDWNEMIMLQNSVILKGLRYFSHTIRDFFSNPFEIQVWNNFFHCAIAFLTQDALQLENFSHNKRSKIISRYNDMRRETGFEIRSMWFNLGQHKIRFVPEMVGRFLEMTLIPETELRKATIPIFFDMMQCEMYSSPTISYIEYRASTTSQSREIKKHFLEFENEMITQLDMLVEGGCGDEQYKDLFFNIMTSLCENHSTLREQGLRFVNTVTRLMRRLLEYRTIINDESKENRMSCTVNLLEFYNDINRKEMYIRYLYKLCDLHLECDNYTEAAFTLKLHAKLLKWSDDPLSSPLKHAKYPLCETHRELKEKLYYDIIDYFNKGKMWECGINVCKELVWQYENEVFDYIQLSALLQKMAILYDNIMKQMRPEPEYFRVAYYGKGFPTFLENKVFIYRGKEYERLSDFSARLQNQFPNAQLMTKLAPPGEEITLSNNHYLQINKVDPILDEKKRFSGKPVNSHIMKYYKVNDVQKFTYSRPIRKGDRDLDNEFANMWLERTNLVTTYALPGILRWFPVTSTYTFEVSPLENAIETMESTNSKIKELAQNHHRDPHLPINPLSMLLNGVVDAAVMGGITNYEKAFFTQEYLAKNNSKKDLDDVQKLKDLIACQIPLLEAGLRVHKAKAPDSLRPFHERMEQCFDNLKSHVEDKYGKRGSFDLSPTTTLRLEHSLVRRAKTVPPPATISPDRSSQISMASDNSTSNSQVSQKSTPSIRAHSVFVKPSSPSPHKGKRRESSTYKRNSSTSLTSQASQSEWYDNKEPEKIIELNEQLQPQRPLRPDPEKRSSRPSSGQFLQRTPQSSSRSNSRPSSGASVSTSSTDSSGTPPQSMNLSNEAPPPLPQKQAYANYSNLSELGLHNSHRFNAISYCPRMKEKPPLPVKDDLPPKKPNRPYSSMPSS